ncbi:MAG: aspartate-semialdehyde dehydrogenase [Clostridia bacterium]|nr:aspartate-semialdehyde dehydrogenase [Clostridia bacterium]
MKNYKVGIIGATGMVGQRFISLLNNHPNFKIVLLAASSKSAGKTYEEAVKGRFLIDEDIPEFVKSMKVLDAEADKEYIAKNVDFVFCATSLSKEETKILEESYAKLECPVVSNNSAHRHTKDVPMIIPEINPEHAEIIISQRKRLGTKKGFVAVKSNCSLQSYVPAIAPLLDLGVDKVAVCTYQAISGAGKTFETMPEILDNVIPFISGEEEKSEIEPLKIFGKIKDNEIVPSDSPKFTSQCIRVPVSDGHTAAVFFSLKNKVSKQEILNRWANYKNPIAELNLPSAPKQFLHYFEEDNLPQPKLQRELENGMAISLGRLREDSIFDYRFIGLSHNTKRGAAGGAVLLAELLCEKGYI